MFEFPFEDGIDHLLFNDPKPEEYGFDPGEVDEKEWADAIEVARTIAYQVAEGTIEIKEDEDGELRLYPNK